MDICFLVWEYPPKIVGGLGTYAYEISRQFVKMEHNVVLFTMNDGTLRTRELMSGVEVHRPLLLDVSDILPDVVAEELHRWGHGLNFFANIFLYNLLSGTKIVNFLIPREGKHFDLVSYHDWLSVMGGISVKKALGIPGVFHIHSTEKGRSLGNGSPTVIELERKGAEKADLIVTVSYAMKDELVMLGLPKEKIRVVWNGVDADKYDPNRVDREAVANLRKGYDIGEDMAMGLFIGRLTGVKGADKLILALPHILEQHPNFRLVVVGKGEMGEYLKELAASLGVADKVIFRYEMLSEEERILHYAAADLCVFPSLYEPFGIVALEAMAMGKPVVVGARGISGMREIVINTGPDQCGYHINPYDPRDLAWGVNNLLADPNQARRLGSKGRERVLKEFTWRQAAERTLKVYEEACGR